MRGKPEKEVKETRRDRRLCLPEMSPEIYPGEREIEGGDGVSEPTAKQINFAKELVEQLGKEDEYDFLEITESWTREEVSELIDNLLTLRDERKRR